MEKQQTEPKREERRYPAVAEIMSLMRATTVLTRRAWEMSARAGYKPWFRPFNETITGLEDARVKLLEAEDALGRALEATRGTEKAIAELNRLWNERRDKRRGASRVKRNATRRAARAAHA